MSLDYDYTKAHDLTTLELLHGGNKPEEECTEAELIEWNKTQYLCFLLYFCGVNSITFSSIDKAWDRIETAQRAGVHVLKNQDGAINYTKEDLVYRIGYKTNVENISDARFNKKVVQYLKK